MSDAGGGTDDAIPPGRAERDGGADEGRGGVFRVPASGGPKPPSPERTRGVAGGSVTERAASLGWLGLTFWTGLPLARAVVVASLLGVCLLSNSLGDRFIHGGLPPTGARATTYVVVQAGEEGGGDYVQGYEAGVEAFP